MNVVVLSTDDAVQAIVIGDHPQASLGTLDTDADLIEAIQEGWVVAGLRMDGTLVFSLSPALLDAARQAGMDLLQEL